jgi:hypothetical protein
MGCSDEEASLNSLIAANFFTVCFIYHRGMWQMIIYCCQLLYLLWKPTGTTDYNIWFCTIAYYSIRLPGVYATSTQKTYFRMSKKLAKNFAFTYPQYKCVCKDSPKTDTFYDLCKKDKNYHVKCLIFSTKVCLFTHDTSIYRETTLWACSMWRCTCRFFVSIFLSF